MAIPTMSLDQKHMDTWGQPLFVHVKKPKGYQKPMPKAMIKGDGTGYQKRTVVVEQ